MSKIIVPETRDGNPNSLLHDPFHFVQAKALAEEFQKTLQAACDVEKLILVLAGEIAGP
jgi:hypothetical protein